MLVDGSAMEINMDADTTDVTERPQDHEPEVGPVAGMLGFAEQ